MNISPSKRPKIKTKILLFVTPAKGGFQGLFKFDELPRIRASAGMTAKAKSHPFQT
jgi:hypothetical protein